MIAGLRDLAVRIAALFRSRSLDSRIDEELRFHLEMQIEENRKRGMNPKDARDAALRLIGGIDQAKEKFRDVRSFRLVEDFYHDLKFGIRMLFRKPKFALAAIVILALAIGPNTAVYSVIKGISHRYMPYPDPSRLVNIWSTHPRSMSEGNKINVSLPDYLDFAKGNHSLESAALYTQTRVGFTRAGEPEQLLAVRTTASLFNVVKRAPVLGRLFAFHEDQTGAEPVVIISYRLWQRKFSSNTGILGKIVGIDGKPHTIAGVMPEDFVFPDINFDLWLPYTPTAAENSRQARYNQVVARLKPHVSRESAQNDLKEIAAILAKEYPNSNAKVGVSVDDDHSIGMGEQEKILLYLGLLSVFFVLLIACANISSLLLARATERKREFAIRASLGGVRMRILRQALTESVLLAMIGGILGVFVGFIWLKGILAIVPSDMPNQERIGIDGMALIYTAGIALLSSVVFGILPALRSAGNSVMEDLKEGSRASTDRVRHRFLSGLVIAETAMAVWLLILSGLLIRSYRNEISMNPGFDRSHLLAVHLTLPESKYQQPAQIINFIETAVTGMKNQLKTENVAAAQMAPMDGSMWRFQFSFQGRPPEFLSEYSTLMMVTSNYFQTMKIPLLRGQYFSGRENPIHPKVIVNETMTRRYLADEPNPIGRMIKIGKGDDPKSVWMEIAGVVGDVKDYNFREPQVTQVYIPYGIGKICPNYVVFFIRTKGDLLETAPVVRSLIHSIDPEQPISVIRSMEEIVGETVANLRAAGRVLIILSGFALVLAALGIYSTISYVVSERMHEIGIRLAFGASRNDIFRLVFSRGLVHLATGLAVGITGAFISMNLLKSLLFGITSLDSVSYLGTVLVLAASGILAMLVPARRAMSVHPMILIRRE
jgi:predicted permease